jgi:tRNA-2-methylthio-N6-dimethylallyladenosine synthase
MNFSDAERVVGFYKAKNWGQTKSEKEADEIIVVTCSVRQTAEDRVYGLINNLGKLKKEKPNLKIILTGCMLRYPLKWLKEKMPAVDEFKKISDFTQKAKPIHQKKIHAYIPIMEGCNQFCSYCVVPYARGREKSRPFSEIICEIKELIKRGYQEITLLGQNVNSYGKDLKNKKHSFAHLLTEINKIEGLKKISFLTSNPWDLTDEIISAISLPKVDRYLHLPVQSGDDDILKKMNRHYNADNYLKLIERIRKKIPNIQIGTDIIVGFPGETEKQFQNTLNLCKKVDFIKAYVSMYSPRFGTTAFRFDDDVSHQEKRRRWKILDDLIN